MENQTSDQRRRGILFAVCLIALAGFLFLSIPAEVQAAGAGFLTRGKNTYYLDANGKYHKGWLKLNGSKYYFDTKTGKMHKGWQYNKKGAKKRYFNKKTGVMTVSGNEITKIGCRYYYFRKNGCLKTGWLKLNGNKYYFDAKGRMCRNTTRTIKGKQYTFDAAGALMTTAYQEEYEVRDGYVIVSSYGKEFKLYPAYMEIPGIADGTVDDVTVLAAVADREMGYSSLEGMMGICMAVLNRSLDENTAFPEDFRQAIFQTPMQFCEDINGSFEKFRLRIENPGTDAWFNEPLAREAAEAALELFEGYVANGTPRTIEGYKTDDFNYIGFMTPKAFRASGAKPSKKETFDGICLFFDCWNKAWGNI